MEAHGIWPLQGMVNELPYHVRKENVLLFGLWFGTKKPNVNTFLKPFTQECQSLSTFGFKLHSNNIVKQCRVIAAVMMCDSVARPILQNIMGAASVYILVNKFQREMELLGFIHTKMFPIEIVLQP